LDRLPKDEFHEVTTEKITVREKMTLLLDRLHADGQVLFDSLFSGARTRMDVVVTFLAMLELVKMRAIRIVQEFSEGPIIIEAAGGAEEVANVIAQQAEHEEERDGN
jgi:segregation and condensation protein A